MKDIILESELKVLDVLWNEGDLTAADLMSRLEETEFWCDATTLQVIRTCIAKGLIKKLEPHFTCHIMITKEEAEKRRASEPLKISLDSLIVSLLGGKHMTAAQLDKLHHMVQEFGQELVD